MSDNWICGKTVVDCCDPQGQLLFLEQKGDELTFRVLNVLSSDKLYDLRELPEGRVIYKRTVSNPQKYTLEDIYVIYFNIPYIPFVPKFLREHGNTVAKQHAINKKQLLLRWFTVDKSYIIQ